MSGVQVRAHQRETGRTAEQIIAGAFPGKLLVLDCTPGGGKTGSGAVLANRLIDAGVVQRVLWVVPRLSLAEQVRDAYENWPSSTARRLEVVDALDCLPVQPAIPGMPTIVGGVTTYQSIASKGNWKRFREAVSAYRTLLILDEVQFLNDEYADQDLGDPHPGWSRKVKQVQEAASFTLVMSGTLWRTDDRKMPFVPYERRADGKQYPIAHISYDLRTAVAERAVLPTEWRTSNGIVEYAVNGVRRIADLLDNGDEEESRKVRTFLQSETAVAGLLDRMVSDWRDWSARVYRSRMIVMADTQTEAKRITKYLQTHHNISCVLATSKEEHAGRQLRHFRERRTGQCIVTVAMAYVGFDCPDLTHLAYLSATRAPSWMLQSFARVSRFDSAAPVDYDHQHAFVYAPDDQRMRAFMEWLRQDQDMGIADRRGRTSAEKGETATIDIPDSFEPIDAVLGTTAIETLHSRIPPEHESQLIDFMRKCPTANAFLPSQLYEVLKAAGHNFGAKPESNSRV